MAKLTDKQAHAIAAAALKAYPMLLYNALPTIVELVDAMHASMGAATVVVPFATGGMTYDRGDTFPLSSLPGGAIRGLLQNGSIRLAPAKAA